jgi:hypothetical protein
VDALKLKYIGEDFWCCPVYKDQYGTLWKDVDLGESETPSLFSVTENDFDGEPLFPLKKDHQFVDQFRRNKKEFEYMMLGRLQSDCETHLSEGCHPSCRIKDEDIEGVVKNMKELWNQFTEEEKPVWLTWEQILDYERRLTNA